MQIFNMLFFPICTCKFPSENAVKMPVQYEVALTHQSQTAMMWSWFLKTTTSWHVCNQSRSITHLLSFHHRLICKASPGFMVKENLSRLEVGKEVFLYIYVVIDKYHFTVNWVFPVCHFAISVEPSTRTPLTASSAQEILAFSHWYFLGKIDSIPIENNLHN